uniref:Uncharacterized protein MANES_01G043100 n=1 Tax=Rhizophora mucronata TaxID=61149 RepID=A0A2P2NUD6_RHIMU
MLKRSERTLVITRLNRSLSLLTLEISLACLLSMAPLLWDRADSTELTEAFAFGEPEEFGPEL